jgi:hypothetical protein
MTIKLPKSVLSRICALIILGIAATNLSDLRAQLVVDAGGPRNAFFGTDLSSDGGTFGLKGFSTKLDTAAQSLEGIYFSRTLFGRTNVLHDPANGLGGWLYGLDLKFTAQNGVLNLNSWPQTDLSAIINYSWATETNKHGQRSMFSVTLRETPFFAQDPVFDKLRATGQQLYTKDAFGNTIAATFCYVPAQASWISVAISAGFSATNNYGKLPKVTVGKSLFSNSSQTVVGSGQTARSGIFKTYNAFPLTLMLPISPDAMDCELAKTFSLGFNAAAKFAFGIFNSDAKKTDYDLIIAPYGSFVPGDLGAPMHGVGVNFVVRGLSQITKEDKDGPHYEGQKLTFPISIFVDRANAFSGKPSTTVGAGLIFKWP